MRGNVTQRGERSFRLKFDAGGDLATGKRLTRFVTFRGTKREAQKELARLISQVSDGSYIEPAKLTVADYVRRWIDNAEVLNLRPKTAERYRQLIEGQIIPHLGALAVQKLRPAAIVSWHATLLKSGGAKGKGLSARTVGHAHRVLGKALKDAVPGGLLLRNPAADISPPRVPDDEMKVLDAGQVATVLESMADTPIFTAVIIFMATGLRRGELMGLQWGDVNLDTGRLEIRRAVEKTKAYGLQLKPPKTKRGRRGITLPAYAIEVLKQHRTAALETRMSLGIGKLPPEAFVFGAIDGSVRDPDRMTQDWKRFTAARKLPKVTLQGLRHTHASALLASGIDVVKASHRLGHSSPKVTLQVYAHLFSSDDADAAAVTERIIRRTSPGTK